jgi:hypothetical protein
MPASGTRIVTNNPIPNVRVRATALATYQPMDWVTPGGPPRWVHGGTQIVSMGCHQLEGRGEPDEMCDYEVTSYDPNLDLPDGDCVDFNSFEIHAQLEHKFVQSYTREELREYITAYSLLHRSRIVAKEAMTGYLTSANPSLISEADTITGLDTTVLGALAAVEDGLAARIGNGIGMVHMTPGVFSLLRGHFTVTGHRVVADAGYTGGAPSTGTVTAGESWIYGSGPIYLETTPVTDNGDTDASAFELTTNTGVIDIHQYAVLAFEPCSVVAAQIANINVSVS